MTTSILSSALLQQFDPSVFTQRLYQRNTTAPTTAAATDFASLLAIAGRMTAAPNQQPLLVDLNLTRTQQYGVTYGFDGTASRSTTNTILVGYG